MFTQSDEVRRSRGIVRSMLLAGMMVVGLMLLIGSGISPTLAGTSTEKASASTVCEPGWLLVSSPNPAQSDSRLMDLEVIAPDNIMAVGSHMTSTGEKTLIERWDGVQWALMDSPNAGGQYDNNYLVGVAAVNANDVWAVGNYSGASSNETMLTMHWDGRVWTIVPIPSCFAYCKLNAVDASPQGEVWAVGSTTGAAAYHWTGTAWESPYMPPIAGGGQLEDVEIVAPGNVWAVGSNGLSTSLILHRFDGQWHELISLPGELKAIAAVSPTDMWAVGTKCCTHGYSRTFAAHWEGTMWIEVETPNLEGSDYLEGVAAVAGNDVSAVGMVSTSSGMYSLTMRWDGSTWSIVPSENMPQSNASWLKDVEAVSGSDIWSVGWASSTFAVTLVEHRGRFTDIAPGSPFYSQIDCLAGRGVLGGYSDCTFRPNNNVTRGQLAKVVSNSAGFNDPQTTQMFQDVPVGSTYFDYVGRLASRGYMSGYACSGAIEPCIPPGNLPYFRPNNKASRGQLTKIVSNAAGYQDSIPTSVQTFTDVPTNHTFWLYVERLLLNRPGVMGGYPCGGAGEPCDSQHRNYFRPGENVTRGQTAKIVANTFFPNCQSPAPMK